MSRYKIKYTNEAEYDWSRTLIQCLGLLAFRHNVLYKTKHDDIAISQQLNILASLVQWLGKTRLNIWAKCFYFYKNNISSMVIFLNIITFVIIVYFIIIIFINYFTNHTTLQCKYSNNHLLWSIIKGLLWVVVDKVGVS